MITRRVCAAALVITAAIHLAAVPEHLMEWRLAAAFFVVLSVVEIALAIVVLRSPDRRLLLVGAVVSAASVALWVTSRTVGLPIGPEAFEPEAALTLDMVATALELAAALLFVQLARRSAPVAASIHVTQ